MIIAEITHRGRRYHVAKVIHGKTPQGEELAGRLVMVKVEFLNSDGERVSVPWEHVMHVMPSDSAIWK